MNYEHVLYLLLGICKKLKRWKLHKITKVIKYGTTLLAETPKLGTWEEL